MDKIFRFVTLERTVHFARYALALILAWFGAMNFTSVGEGIVTGWLSETMLISGMAEMDFPFAWVIGASQLIAAVVLASGRAKFVRIGAIMAMAFSGLALLLMVLANVWIEAEGGFPVIGAGQGIIKYLSILGVAGYLLGHYHPDYQSAKAMKQRHFSNLAILFGLILVLGWIGGMKFTAIEAAGIRPLLETSPFFSWLLDLFSEQGASNFIGVVEILTALLLTGWFYSRPVFQMGAFLCVVTFLGTLSFLITLPGWDQMLGGFPALSRSGHFLLKDLVMLAGTLILVAQKKKA